MPLRPTATRSAIRARRSLGQMTTRALAVIAKAVDEGDVVTAKWVVEMRLGRPPQHLEHSGEDSGPIPIRFIEVTSVALHAPDA